MILPLAGAQIGNAKVLTRGAELIVETGEISQTWKWTGKGFVTTSLRNLATRREWATRQPAFECDWAMEGLIDERSEARLAGLTCKPMFDDPYTSDHLEVIAKIEYAAARIRVLYVVWAYPDSPGIRMQLHVQGLDGFTAPAISTAPAAAPRAEYVPIRFDGLKRRAIGYYNHTQKRNQRDTEILREEVIEGAPHTTEVYDWASILSVEDGDEGLCLVKESHKCVNQKGVDTGDFRCEPAGLTSTGWGVGAPDILTERARWCWANWRVVYQGGDDGRELAIKRFDRKRYPVDPARDIAIMANTWGSSLSSVDGRSAAREDNVLREIDSCADLGIDVLQIDDGWQVPFGSQHWQPAGRWAPHPEMYPEGWKNVRAAAGKRGLILGLWAAWVIGADDLKKNQEEGGFRHFKIDFAKINSYADMEGLIDRVRALIDHSGQKARVNWDVTENPARIGYFFGREFGNIYLENRKPETPPSTVYTPYLVLRDAWQVAQYTNLNRFQITIQNIDLVNREKSNAWEHTHPYCFAITLMATPIFFQLTQRLSDAARRQLRPLIALYKKHRREIYEGYVFPIGDKPDDAGWTGFQSHDFENNAGYLTVFREKGTGEGERSLRVRFVAGKRIALENLLENTTGQIEAGPEGMVRFSLPAPKSFGFFRYQVL